MGNFGSNWEGERKVYARKCGFETMILNQLGGGQGARIVRVMV